MAIDPVSQSAAISAYAASRDTRKNPLPVTAPGFMPQDKAELSVEAQVRLAADAQPKPASSAQASNDSFQKILTGLQIGVPLANSSIQLGQAIWVAIKSLIS